MKIVGCWNGLAKRKANETSWEDDRAPMRRAVAFSHSIKDSKLIAAMFQQVMDEYMQHHEEEEGNLRCEVEHVDGSFNVLMRNQKLDWLKENAGENVCRILSNASSACAGEVRGNF